MKKISLLLACLGLLCTPAMAQLGGASTYSFLKIPVSARIAALSGSLALQIDDDPGMGFSNPALLNHRSHDKLMLNSVFHPSGTKQGSVGYTWTSDSLRANFSAGAIFVQHGRLRRTTSDFKHTGDFRAADMAFQFGLAQQDGDYSYGLNFKLVNSIIDDYTSLGVLFDLGGAWHNEEKKVVASLMVKNIGAQIIAFNPGVREPMPFEIQAGISKQLEHLPFRFSLMANNLQVFDIRYEDGTGVDQVLFDPQSDSTAKRFLGDKILRHIAVGGEVLISKNVHLLFGYNHLKRKEMTTLTKRGLAGFSFGVDIRVKKFRITYSKAWYFVAGGSNQLGLQLKVSEFVHQKKRAQSGV